MSNRSIFAARLRRARGAAAALLALAGSSCAKDPVLESGPEGKSLFVLCPRLLSQVDVKASEADVATEIQDVWVVQLASDGSRQLAAPQYITNLDSYDGKRAVSYVARPEESRLVFLVNTHDPDLLGATGNTLARLRNLSLSTPNEQVLRDHGALPFYGEWSGRPVSFGKNEPVELKPLWAKIRLRVRSEVKNERGSVSVSVDNIRLRCVPKKMCYVPDLSSGKFPLSGDVAGKDEVYGEWSEGTLLTEQYEDLVDFIVPLNLRGSGTSTRDEERDEEHAPDDKCTYVEVDYTYAVGGFLEARCTAKVYLGHLDAANYDVRPGSEYTVHMSINGANVADTRITLRSSKYIEGQFDHSYTDGANQRWAVKNRYTKSAVDRYRNVDMSMGTFSSYVSYIYSNCYCHGGDHNALWAPGVVTYQHYSNDLRWTGEEPILEVENIVFFTAIIRIPMTGTLKAETVVMNDKCCWEKKTLNITGASDGDGCVKMPVTHDVFLDSYCLGACRDWLKQQVSSPYGMKELNDMWDKVKNDQLSEAYYVNNTKTQVARWYYDQGFENGNNYVACWKGSSYRTVESKYKITLSDDALFSTGRVSGPSYGGAYYKSVSSGYDNAWY